MMLNEIMKEASNKFWEDLGKDLLKKAAATLVTETVRTRIDLWKQMRLKKLRRDIDIVWREEDRVYKERREEEKRKREKAREKAEKAEEEKEAEQKPQPPTPEDKHVVRPAPEPIVDEDDSEQQAPTPDPVPKDPAPPAPPAPGEEPRGDEDTDGSLHEDLTFLELSS